MNTYSLRDCATDASRFWEPRRVLYNLVLATIVGIYFGITYPISRTMLTLDFCLGLFLLAVVANVAYCAAYIVDIFAQCPAFANSGNDLAGCSLQSEQRSPRSLALLQWACLQRVDIAEHRRGSVA